MFRSIVEFGTKATVKSRAKLLSEVSGQSLLETETYVRNVQMSFKLHYRVMGEGNKAESTVADLTPF